MDSIHKIPLHKKPKHLLKPHEMKPIQISDELRAQLPSSELLKNEIEGIDFNLTNHNLLGYYGEIGFGTPTPQPMTVHIDTGSGVSSKIKI